MSIFDLFTKKEEPKKTQRDQISAVRSTTQQIAGKLQSIRFQEAADISGRINQRQMDTYRQTIHGLTMMMDRAQILRLDTSSIDQQILFMAEYLPDAVRYGNTETIDRIIKGLTFGITKGRKDIGEKDMERASSIIDKRLRTLQMYRDIVELSMKIDDLEKTIAKQDKELDVCRKKYDECRAKLKEMTTRRPDLVRELNELGFGSNQLSPEARALDNARMKVIQVANSIEDLSRIRATNEAARVQCESSIRTLEIQLTQGEALVDENTLEDIRKQQEEFKKELLQVERQIDEMEDINKDFNRALDSIYSSPEMVDRIIRHEMEYEALEKREASKEAGIAEGIAAMQAQEQEENENEAMLVF